MTHIPRNQHLHAPFKSRLECWKWTNQHLQAWTCLTSLIMYFSALRAIINTRTFKIIQYSQKYSLLVVSPQEAQQSTRYRYPSRRALSVPLHSSWSFSLIFKSLCAIAICGLLASMISAVSSFSCSLSSLFIVLGISTNTHSRTSYYFFVSSSMRMLVL